MKKSLIVIAVIALIAFIIYPLGASNRITIKRSHEIRELIVAIDEDLPGFFTIEDKPYGFQYELLSEYARHVGIEMKVISESSVPHALQLMRDMQVDMVATTPKHIFSEAGEYITLTPEYNSNYVILASRETASRMKKGSTLSQLVQAGSRMIFQQGFTFSQSYDRLLDSVRTMDLFVSSRSGFELMKDLSEGLTDFVVIEQLEAELGCAVFRKIREVYHFDEEVSLMLAVDPRNRRLADSFNKWLDGYKKTDDYAVLYSLYYQKDLVRQFAGNVPAVAAGSVSPFDDVIRAVASRSRHDWRLLLAIAFHESRFNPHVVSSRGAKGIMQIMPSIARQFDVPAEEVDDTEVNVLLAVRLLDRIESSLKLGPGISEYDRMCLILASYNGGIGHVLDARRLARKHGSDPDSWQDVSFFLMNKTHPDYFDAELVKSGAFKGKQTLAFVNNVISKYTAYCSRLSS